MINTSHNTMRIDTIALYRITASLLLALFLDAIALVWADEGQSPFYLRLGIGAEWSRDTSFSDRDCSATDPAALFGCSNGPDGRPIGAYGDFGSSAAFEIGVGRYINHWLRTEIAVHYASDLDFSGQANFSGVALNQQPVSADANSLVAALNAYIDLAALFDNKNAALRPFIGAGIGYARNRISAMTYQFPSLGAGDVTITPSGEASNFAWSLSAGVDYRIARDKTVELLYRYSDMGSMRTDPGDITVVRDGVKRLIRIDSTEADLSTNALMLGFRYRF